MVPWTRPWHRRGRRKVWPLCRAPERPTIRTIRPVANCTHTVADDTDRLWQPNRPPFPDNHGQLQQVAGGGGHGINVGGSYDLRPEESVCVVWPAVGTLKSCLKKHLYAERHGLQQGLDIHQLVDKFLLIYRTTPHSTTGRTPAKLLLKHQPRTRFSFLKPVASSMPASKNLGKPLRWRFETQERVLLRNYLGGPSG